MIDDIVEMILKEARVRYAKDPLSQLPKIIEDLECKLFDIQDASISNERRIKEND